MTRSLRSVVLVGTMLCLANTLASAQSTSTSTETRSFEVIAAAGNTVVVKLPEGTREMTVPDSFRFMVDGHERTVHELKPGMTGTATITTRTITTPVTATEVKNGTVVSVAGSSLYVRETGGNVRMFTQGEIDKRGIRIMREGKAAQLSEFHSGDKISATIVTTRPPTVVTEREVQAMLNRVPTAPLLPATPAEPAHTATAPAPIQSPPVRARAAQPAPRAEIGTTGTQSKPAETLPKTAGTMPLIGYIGLASLGLGRAGALSTICFIGRATLTSRNATAPEHAEP